MSHTVTVTRTTTTSSTSAVLLNVGYITTVPGILKLLETVVGIVCLALIGYYSIAVKDITQLTPSRLFFYLTAFGFLLGTFLLLVSSVCNITTASMLSKTLFELLYHVFAFVFYFSGSLAILIPLVQNSNLRRYRYSSSSYDALIATSVLGLINSGFYLASAIFSYRSYRGV